MKPRAAIFWGILFGIIAFVALLGGVISIIIICAKRASSNASNFVANSTPSEVTSAPPVVMGSPGTFEMQQRLICAVPTAPPTVTLDAQSFPPPVYAPQSK